MKALSLWQPWASLIALGLKHFETRSWATNYRGPLLICATAKQPKIPEMSKLLWKIAQRLDPPQDIVRWAMNLPTGCALCLVDLVSVRQVQPGSILEEPWLLERDFGDYSYGRFAWELGNVRRFKAPWDVKGRQGFFSVPNEEIAKHELEQAA